MRNFNQPSETFGAYDPAAPRVPPDISTPARAAAVRIEDEIRHDQLETGVFIAQDGWILLRKQGEPDRVGFTVRELRRMKGACFTHNHPGGGSFSPHDLACAGEAALAELRAVTPIFRHFVLNLPVMSEVYWQQTFEHEQRKMAAKLRDAVRTGALHPSDFGCEAQHLAWVSIATKMGFIYRRIKS